MSQSPPWMPLDVDDYMSDTIHLTAAEHGAYMLLIMRYWKDGGLPNDERAVQKFSRLTPEQWAESRDTLAAFFGSGWRHNRIDEELAKASEIIEKRRAAAQAKHDRSKSSAHAEQVQSKSTYTRVPPVTTDISSSLRSDDDSAPAKPTPRSELETVLDEARAKAVVDHRQRLRKPLTAHAASLLAKALAEFPDPNAAADTMIERGWQTIKPGWGQDIHQRAGPPVAKPMNPTLAAALRLKDEIDAVSPSEIEGNHSPPRLVAIGGGSG